jgi:hypothetical protein
MSFEIFCDMKSLCCSSGITGVCLTGFFNTFPPDTKAKNLGPGGNVLKKPVRQTPVMPELQQRDFILQNISKLIHIHHQWK